MKSCSNNSVVESWYIGDSEFHCFLQFTTAEKMPKVGNGCPFSTSYRPVAGDRGGFSKSHQTSSEQN